MLIGMLFPAVLAMAAPPGGGGGQQQGGMFATMVPLLVIFAIFYFLMIRPQQKQQKQHKEMLSALKKGDKVVTRGGIIGSVAALEDTVVTVEVAENVRVRFTRDAISGIETPNA